MMQTGMEPLNQQLEQAEMKISEAVMRKMWQIWGCRRYSTEPSRRICGRLQIVPFVNADPQAQYRFMLKWIGNHLNRGFDEVEIRYFPDQVLEQWVLAETGTMQCVERDWPQHPLGTEAPTVYPTPAELPIGWKRID